MNPWLIGGAIVAVYLMNKQPALPNAGSPTEYWIDPVTYALWYEFGGTVTAPQAGMRPASSWEISTYWPPVNHPELGTAETVVY
jgi:hypothetical protein